ncbi:MAG: hypothetical protein RBR74_09125 [Ignavibacteriaceae bacterium]|jgi:hypothetical protein|nr:hypothetical protein [Ignavibacteriaceae bacterium]
MPKIIQFTHPGGEHKPDERNGGLKSWNTGSHKRKYMLSSGKYILNEKILKGDLLFWGEWEPPSSVIKLNKTNFYEPLWLHKPLLPLELPLSNGYQKSYQNTDPFVFGKSFKYLVCKQFKPKTLKTTQLAKLDKGSVILFGSTAGKNRGTSFFQLDTVFVISKYIDYDISDPEALMNVDDLYRKIVFKMAFPFHNNKPLTLRLYKGATFENKYNGMYSFVPARVWNNNASGFPRVKLHDIEYLTNNLNSAPKITELPDNEIKKFWEKIVKISRKQGCVEGVGFNYVLQK